MRIGIISKYYKNYNFGGLLQAYALVKVLENMGHEAQQISFIPNDIKKYGVSQFLKIKVKLFMRKLMLHIHSKKISSLNYNMKCFMNQIPHSPVVTSTKIDSLNEIYDAFIAGSDQIWNPAFAYDEYFLRFADKDKPKIAYAASIGVSDCSLEEQKYLRQQIEPFNYISVREYEGKQLLHNIEINKKVAWVLDPTFLLSAAEWDELDIAEEMALPKRYAAVYLMGNNLDNEELVKRITKEMNLEVITIPFTVSDYTKKKNIRLNLGPKEFVTIIRHAEVVFTDSFHATVFSIINGVNFYCLNRSGEKTGKSMNSRLDSLFKMLEIEPRWIVNYESYKKIGTVPSFERIHNKLDEYRIASIQYLENAIEGKESGNGIEL